MKRKLIEFLLDIKSNIICALPSSVRNLLRNIYRYWFIKHRKPRVGKVNFGDVCFNSLYHNNRKYLSFE